MKNNNGIKVNNGLCPAGKCWVLHAESPQKRSTSRAPSQPTEHQGILALITCEPNEVEQIFINETSTLLQKMETANLVRNQPLAVEHYASSSRNIQDCWGMFVAFIHSDVWLHVWGLSNPWQISVIPRKPSCLALQTAPVCRFVGGCVLRHIHTEKH